MLYGSECWAAKIQNIHKMNCREANAKMDM